VFHNNTQRKNTVKKDHKEFTKESNFWLWFLWILREARIVDTEYSVKGSYVWLDWGYELYTKIYQFAQEAYKESGHKQMQFPTLIKEDTFLKETEFIRNFEDDVFWVDREGNKKLAKGERLALRPTSELIIYPMFARWIRSWRDLPLKIFQNVSIFRCETNETRPLIRNRETIGFIEGHSALATKEEAMQHLELIWKTYGSLFEKLGIPVKLIEVPQWDRFAGSGKTIDGYVVFPHSKSMELFTTAYLGTTFSEIFDIQFLTKERESSFAHLLCYGPSIDRILASIISLYGDDRGLVLLPEISPIQIVVVPIFRKKNKVEIISYAQEVSNKFAKLGFKVQLDDNDLTTPGAKFYETERLGIPLRFEIGNKEYSSREITVARRDTLTKSTLKLNDKQLQEKITTILNNISNDLRKKISQTYDTQIQDLTTLSIDVYLEEHNLEADKMYLVNWCGSQKCAEALEDLSNFTMLGYELESETTRVNCSICSKKGRISVLAKRY